MTRLAKATGAMIAALITACGGTAAIPSPGTTGTLALPTATTKPSLSTAPPMAGTAEPRTAPPVATAEPRTAPAAVTVELRPAFKVPIGPLNHAAAVGTEVWAPTAHSIVRVTTKTRKTTTIDSPVSADAADSFGATDDAVWIGDFDRGRVYRLDRTTGAVRSQFVVPSPVRFAYARGLVWIGSGATRTMFTIDPAGSDATRTDFPHELVAGDSVWGAVGSRLVVRVAIDTRERTSIQVVEPAGPGDCSVKGSAQSLWLLCHGNDTGARIDPETNSVMGTLDVGSTVFGGVLNLEHWAFFFEGKDEAGAHQGRVVRVDLSTNQIDRIFDLGPDFDPNPPVMAADALWVPNPATGELWVLPVSDLLTE